MSTVAFGQGPRIDLSGHLPDSAVTIKQDGTRVVVQWPIAESESGSAALQLKPGEPLIESLSVVPQSKPAIELVSRVQPVLNLTVGSRDLREGWTVFFDNPPRRPHETFAAALEPQSVRVISRGPRRTVVFDGLSAGPFRGELHLTVYPGCRLLHVESVLRTEKDACAILYDTGLASSSPSWKSIAWMDTSDTLQRKATEQQTSVAPLAVRYRALFAERETGTLAVFPPPHQYLYPLDFADNFGFTWHGRGFQKDEGFGFGIRQPPEGDKRFVPWINAPPGTDQRLGVFYLLSAGAVEKAVEEVRRFTNGDRYRRLDGYRTFTSHYHVEHTLDFLNRQRAQPTDGIPKGLESPPFVKAFQNLGVEIVHLAEFHVRHSPEFIAQRLKHLQTMHAECRRLSNDQFLLLPGEEPNVHLGGHWISFFPKPVNWLLHPPEGTPFEQEVEGLGKVYAVHNADEIQLLMEREQGLMWTAHPRIKSSFGFPDKYKDREFYLSDRFLGAAWKAMPADLSLPRLGTRCLDLLSDMANWGQKKYVLGEVDVFKVMPEYELYGHMNINYLNLDAIPKFDDGWQPVLDALRQGRFFVSTGEVVIPEFQVGGKPSGESLPRPEGLTELTARVEWTFPPSFAEIITGDGTDVNRLRLDMTDHAAFGKTEIRLPVDLRKAKWVRLEVWDVAANGAFTQPVWVE
jgi:hypothetical protein